MTYEILKFQEISQDFKDFTKISKILEQDFTRFCLARFQDFMILPKISKFPIRFLDFIQDFKVWLVI